MKIFGFEIRKFQEPEKPSGFNLCNSLNFGEFSDQYTALNLSAVYRAVEIISDSCAILPLKIKSASTKNCDATIDHPVSQLFSERSTIGNIGKFTLMKLLITDVLLRGNGFAKIERAKDGTVKDLRYLEPGEVVVNYNKTTGKLLYNVLGKNVEPVNMIHLVLHSKDGINGISVLSFAARSIKIGSAADNSAKNFFSKGCNLNGVLKVHSVLSEQKKEDIRQNWRSTYGTGGSGVAVLEGNMDYTPIQVNAADSQLLQSRLYSVQDIARFFGISPILLGDLSHSTGFNLEATQNSFLLHTLMPYIKMVENEFNRKLLKPSETDLEVCLDETALLKTDKAATSSYYNALLQSGVLCINEVRRELGYPEIKNGDKHIIAYTDISQNTIDNGD